MCQPSVRRETMSDAEHHTCTKHVCDSTSTLKIENLRDARDTADGVLELDASTKSAFESRNISGGPHRT